MDKIKTEIINETFAGYADAKSAITGFVAWAWEERESTLDLLQGAPSPVAWAQLADDVAYTVRQADQYRGEDFDEAALEWLKYNRTALIQAFESELWEDAIEQDPIPGWAIKTALAYLIEHSKIDVGSANSSGQTWLARELAITPRTVRRWISGERKCYGLRARAVRQVIERAIQRAL